ncbi:MAG: hypothetical protein ACYSSP_00945 [Planctomycetota bacterium]|jgi:hypothetical protein
MNKKDIATLVILTLFSLTLSGCNSSGSAGRFPPGSPQAREVAETAK